MKMFLEITLIIFIVIVVFFLSFSFAKNILAPDIKKYSIGSVCFKERCFKVELAETRTQRDRGLMNRKELDRNEGMLFIFEKEGIYPFWMKNTFIPLDIIWIDSNNKIVYIGQNVQPCKSLICPSIVPSGKAKYVLEVNAGICKEINLRVGEEVKLSI
jgi:uncharacterized membrane protein (UPF0127 family)